MSLKTTTLRLPGLVLIESARHGDERGWFTETWKASAFRSAGLDFDFPQDNMASSERGVIRGLHYQLPPHAQAKLVRAVVGRILDVAVDLRRGSPTFGQWESVELDAETGAALLVPEGFAHGYQVLTERAIVAYKAGAEYAPASERTLLWNDPGLGVEWRDVPPLISPKDAKGVPLADLAEADLF